MWNCEADDVNPCIFSILEEYEGVLVGKPRWARILAITPGQNSCLTLSCPH